MTRRFKQMIYRLAAELALQAQAAEQPPNIVFIFSDDQTYESIGAYGLTEVKTPNLDRLAERGVSFTHAYNMGAWGGAVCVASRAMLNSGAFVNRAQQRLKTCLLYTSDAADE